MESVSAPSTSRKRRRGPYKKYLTNAKRVPRQTKHSRLKSAENERDSREGMYLRMTVKIRVFELFEISLEEEL